MGKALKFEKILARTKYVLECAVLVALFVACYGLMAKTVESEILNRGRLVMHKAMAIGFVSFFVLFFIPRVHVNTRWMMKFMHEFTHLIFALLFFREIHRFRVDDRDSHVSYSGGWFGYLPITISPYCVPLLTLAILPWRYTTGAHSPFLLGIDFLLGLTFAFHVCCWATQTRLYQTDITGPGVVKSIIAIVDVWVINLCLILLTPTSGVIKAVTRTFWEYPSTFLLDLWKLLF